MDIAFTDLKEKEIINVSDGRKMGHIIDFLFDIETGQVKGVVLPGERKIFKKNEDIFVPLEKIRKIGGDVILVKLRTQNNNDIYNASKIENTFKCRYNLKNYYEENESDNKTNTSYSRDNKTIVRYNSNALANERFQNSKSSNMNYSADNNKNSFVRFKPINNIKYK